MHKADERLRCFLLGRGTNSEFDLERQLSRYKDQVASLQTNHDTSQATILSHSMRFGTDRVGAAQRVA